MPGSQGNEARALIVDDHPIIADALRSALVSLRVFGQIDAVTTIADARRVLNADPGYDLVMLDLNLSDAVGTEAMTIVREEFPETPIVVYSGDESSATVSAAFELGVQGYIPKSTDMPVVLSAIRVVLSGGNYIPPQAVRMLGFTPRQIVTHAQDPGGLPALSPRQRQVLHYLLQGLPNKTIGSRLGVADGTIKTYSSAIYRLFGVGNRAQLILKARANDLI